MSNITTKWIIELADRVSGTVTRITQKVTQASGAMTKWQDKINGITNRFPALSKVISNVGDRVANTGVVIRNLAVMAGIDVSRVSSFFSRLKNTIIDVANQLPALGELSLNVFNRIGSAATNLLKGSLKYIATSFVAIGGVAIKSVLDIEDGLQKINKIAMLSSSGLSALRTEIMGIGYSSGIGATKAIRHFEDIVDKTKNTALSMNILKVATAKASFSFGDVGDVANAYTALSKRSTLTNLGKMGISIFDKKGIMRDFDTITGDIATKLKGMKIAQQESFLKKIGLDDKEAATMLKIVTAGIGGVQATLDKTPGQQLKEVLSKIQVIAIGIAYKVLPYFQRGLAKLSGALDWVKNHAGLLTDILGGFGVVLRVVWFVIKWTTIALSPLIIAMGVLGVVTWIATSPFTALGILFVGLIVLFYTLWQRSEKFRGTIMGMVGVVKEFGKAIKLFVLDSFEKLLKGITGIGSALVKFFKGDWEGAWAAGKDAVKTFTTVTDKGLEAKKLTSKEHLTYIYAKEETLGKIAASEHKGNSWLPEFVSKTVSADSLINDDTDSKTKDKKEKDSKGISATGGGGTKIITMNLNFKQTFNGGSGDIKKIAQDVVSEINDRLRDGLVALD